MRRRAARALATATGLAVMAAASVTPAQAARVANGDFERGNLSGWEKDYFPPNDPPIGVWHVYDEPFVSPLRAARGAVLVPAPPQGEFGAITEQGEESVQILSQVVSLKPNRRHKLRFQLAYFNNNGGSGRGGSGFITPDSLTLAQENQQFRMDVVKPDAGIRAMGGAILDSVYRTRVGDRNRKGYGAVAANLTPYAGEQVRLRFAVAVTQAQLNVGIDAVKIKTRRQR